MIQNAAPEAHAQFPCIEARAVEQKRQEMFLMANKYGMEAAETLRCSQELDALIIKIQENRFPY